MSSKYIEMKKELEELKIALRKEKLAALTVLEQFKDLAKCVTTLQPVVSRLVSASVALLKKEGITDEQINAITEEEGNAFVQAAFQELVEKMRNKSATVGTVGNDNGNSGTGIPGAESLRKPSSASESYEQPGQRPESD